MILWAHHVLHHLDARISIIRVTYIIQLTESRIAQAVQKSQAIQRNRKERAMVLGTKS